MNSPDFEGLRVIFEDQTVGGTIDRLMRDQISPRSTLAPSICVHICPIPTPRSCFENLLSHGAHMGRV